MKVGELIKTRRESMGLLMKQVATLLEVDISYVSKLERCERTASKEQLQKLSDVLQINPKELNTMWLVEKISHLIANEKTPKAALRLVLKSLKGKKIAMAS